MCVNNIKDLNVAAVPFRPLDCYIFRKNFMEM